MSELWKTKTSLDSGDRERMKSLEVISEYFGWIAIILFTVVVAGYAGWFRIVEGLVSGEATQK
jgi:hypothetical protein